MAYFLFNLFSKSQYHRKKRIKNIHEQLGISFSADFRLAMTLDKIIVIAVHWCSYEHMSEADRI